MKIKIFTVVSFFSLFFIFAVDVWAQTASITGTTNSPVTTTKEIVPSRPPAIQRQKDLIIKHRFERREKLNAIRDERKKAMVERVDEKISAMNQTHTARFSTVLEKLMMILNKISDRAQNVKKIPAGISTSAVDSAIADAKTAIDAAKAAVATQAAKSYIIEVASEAALRTTVGSVVSMFRKDIRDVHKNVVDAKQAVQRAEKELVKVRGEKMEKAGETQSIRETPSVTKK